MTHSPSITPPPTLKTIPTTVVAPATARAQAPYTAPAMATALAQTPATPLATATAKATALATALALAKTTATTTIYSTPPPASCQAAGQTTPRSWLGEHTQGALHGLPQHHPRHPCYHQSR